MILTKLSFTHTCFGHGCSSLGLVNVLLNGARLPGEGTSVQRKLTEALKSSVQRRDIHVSFLKVWDRVNGK
jgi:hypothetical protein